MLKQIVFVFFILHIFICDNAALQSVDVFKDPLSDDFIDHINSIQNLWTVSVQNYNGSNE